LKAEKDRMNHSKAVQSSTFTPPSLELSLVNIGPAMSAVSAVYPK
jgi:hypothetical protein